MFSQYKLWMLSLEVEIIFNFVSIPKIMEDDAPFWASLVAHMVKNLPAMQETLGQRSSGEGNGYPLQYSCLENPTDGGAWWLQPMGSQSRT